MSDTVYVSSAQKTAAQAMVKRSSLTGRPVSNSVRKIANAKVSSTNGAAVASTRSSK